MNRRRRLWQAGAVAVSVAAAGCVSQDQIDARHAVADYEVGDYAGAKKLLTPLAKKTNEDFVLNNVRLGSDTLAMYDLVASQAAFLQAYEVLNSYGVNNGGRTLGAVLVDEKIKIWRGEPFERAMANFYLGLTYYMQADYANARGAFENALFKLRDYDQGNPQKEPVADQYNEVDSNFILARYMLARCYQKLGQDDLAAANFSRVKRLRPDLVALADESYNRRANVLLVVDLGQGPHKVADNEGSVIGFEPTPAEVGGVPVPTVVIDGGVQNTTGLNLPLVDLIRLAQDRRWQSIDTIRTVKAVLGTGLIVGGGATAVTAQNRTQAEVGLALLLAGILLKATSQADLRVWDTLPRSTFVIPLYLPAGPHDVTVEFPAAGNLRQTCRGVVAPGTGESTYYFRMQGPTELPFVWPPPTLTGWPAPQPVDGPASPKDR